MNEAIDTETEALKQTIIKTEKRQIYSQSDKQKPD